MVTTDIWIEEFESTPITEERIQNEIDEVLGTLSNERLWEKGAEDPTPHQENILCLTEYLEYLYALWNKRYKGV